MHAGVGHRQGRKGHKAKRGDLCQREEIKLRETIHGGAGCGVAEDDSRAVSVDSRVRSNLARLVSFQLLLWQDLLIPILREQRPFSELWAVPLPEENGPQCWLFSPLLRHHDGMTYLMPVSASSAITELQLVIGGTKNLV